MHGGYVEARGMEYATVELKANDSENDDTEKDEQGDVHEGRHRLQNGRKNNLQAGHAIHQLQRPQHSERAQDLEVEADALARHEHREQARRHDHEVHDVPQAVQVGVLVEYQARG